MRRRRLTALLFVALLSPSVAFAQSKLTKSPRVKTFVSAEYPKEERRAATVVLQITIGENGVVEDAKVVESAGASFDAAALAAVKQFVFEPAEVDNKPSKIRILYKYEFTLQVEAPKTATFEGQVRDRSTGKPLANVEIAVDELRATTDANGKFRIENVPPGKRAVSLSGEKLTALRTEETFEAGKRVDASYDVVVPAASDAAAKEEDRDDLEIVVTAPALEKKVVATEVSAEEARRLPGTQGDVLKVVESMPGVARATAGSGALVVWGAAPDDTRVYVDGVRVPRLYHGGGVRSIIATDLVDAVELAPGGWGVAFGRGLGGLVSVRTRARAADETKWKASASLDVIDAGAVVRAPLTKDLHVAVAARRSHLHSTIAPLTKDETEDLFPIPRYEDAQARLSWAIGAKERLDVTFLHSNDRITRTAASLDPTIDRRESRRTSFERVYARYESEAKTGTSVSVVPWFGVDRSSRTNRFGGIPTELTTDTTLGGLRSSWRTRIDKSFSVVVGLDAEVASADVRRFGSVTSPAREGDARVFGQIPADRLNSDAWKVTTVGLAPYAELDVAPFGSDAFHVVPGVRFDPYFSSVSRLTPIEGDTPKIGSFREDAALEPRVATRWQVVPKRLQLRAAYGRYHQQAAAEDLSSVFGNPLLPAAAAHHAVGGSTVRIFEKTSLETTAFYTVQEDLAMRSALASPLLAQALVPSGDGRAYGVQVLLRQELAQGLTGWVSYTIARSLRRDAPDLRERLSDFDQSHVVTAVGSYALGRSGFEVGARIRASTGFPRTPVVGALFDARRDVSQPLFGPKNTERIPMFFQLDLRVSKKWVTAAGDFEAYLEVQNVTNRENPEEILYSSTYARKDYLTGLPVLPIVGARWSSR